MISLSPTLSLSILRSLAAVIILLCSPNDTFGFEFSKRVEVYTTYAPATVAKAYIEPLLKEGETLSIFRGKLIINASANTHDNILHTLARVDKPAQNLLISIRNNKHQESKTSSPAYIHYSGSRSDGKLTIEKNGSTLTTQKAHHLQQLMLTEGDVGYIKGSTDTYEDTPIFSNGFFTTKKVLVKNGEGFYVRARIKDRLAIISLATEEAKLLRTAVKKQEIRTEITVPLGQWTPISYRQSGSAPSFPSTSNGRKYSTKTADGHSSSLEILVELAP